MIDEPSFQVAEGRLQIVAGNGDRLWDGYPDGMKVFDSRQLPGHDVALLLLEPAKTTGFVPNLVCLKSTGEVVWRAGPETEDSNDFYVSMDFGPRDELYANSWSGYRFRLNASTGDATRLYFTK